MIIQGLEELSEFRYKDSGLLTDYNMERHKTDGHPLNSFFSRGYGGTRKG